MSARGTVSKACFFEKKQQKTFGPAVAQISAACTQGTKVFWFFLSKKNCLLASDQSAFSAVRVGELRVADGSSWAAVVKMSEAKSYTIKTITAAMVRLQGSVFEIKEDLHTAKADLGRIRLEIGVLRSDSPCVETDVTSRLDRLNDRLLAATDPATNYGAAMSEQLARNFLEEVRSLVAKSNAMQIQGRRFSAEAFGPEGTH